jgi:hypothetical protein
MLLTQSQREATGAVEGTSREEDSVEAEDSEKVEEAEVAREGVDPHTTPRENRSRSLSLSRSPSLREELAKSRSRRCTTATSTEPGRRDGSTGPADADNRSLVSAEQQHNHRGQHRNVPEGFQKKVESFNKLRPPTFDHSADPMDADNWLSEIEKKLELTELTEEECVTVAAHQLIVTASAWWDSYCDLHPDLLHIGWTSSWRPSGTTTFPRP